MADITSVQNKHDLVHGTSIKYTFPIRSCDQAVIDALLWKLVTALHIKYWLHPGFHFTQTYTKAFISHLTVPSKEIMVTSVCKVEV